MLSSIKTFLSPEWKADRSCRDWGSRLAWVAPRAAAPERHLRKSPRTLHSRPHGTKVNSSVWGDKAQGHPCNTDALARARLFPAPGPVWPQLGSSHPACKLTPSLILEALVLWPTPAAPPPVAPECFLLLLVARPLPSAPLGPGVGQRWPAPLWLLGGFESAEGKGRSQGGKRAGGQRGAGRERGAAFQAPS